ncbi:MAG: hypothetical protein VB674_10295, partial [Vicinamibacterales bacterium]
SSGKRRSSPASNHPGIAAIYGTEKSEDTQAPFPRPCYWRRGRRERPLPEGGNIQGHVFALSPVSVS